MGLLSREYRRLTFVVVVFGEAQGLLSPGLLTSAPRIFAVLVNDAHTFYNMCMVKFKNLRFGNYSFFFFKFILLHVLNIMIE